MLYKNVKEILVKTQKGSAAIILSLMVSAGVLSTIYFTQKMTGGFLSEHSQSIEEWEKHLVTESAQTLAAYLVANNLILCRQDGWTGKQSNCKWTLAPKTESPADFHLSDEGDSAEGLSYKGKYTLDDVEKEYKVTFQLVDWRSTSIENLIGDVPEAVCRDKNTLKVISEGTCIAHKDSADPINQVCQVNGSDDPDTLCEYIKRVDGDYWIVLSKVEVDYKDPVSNKDLKHIALSGLRRPMGTIQFQDIYAGRNCSLGCKTGTVVSPFTDCRSGTLPAEVGQYKGKASNVVSVKNGGPGAIYALSLMKAAVQMGTPQNTATIDVTPDIVKKAGKEVFLPGEIIKFEYFYECPIRVTMKTIRKIGRQDRVEVTTNTRSQLYEHYRYSLNFNSAGPLGVCYASGTGAPPDETTSVDFVINVEDQQRLVSASCTSGNPSCNEGGRSGSCNFVNIEPRRTFSTPSPVIVKHNALLKEVVRTIYTTPPPVYPNDKSGDGCGNGDGSARDGAS